MKYIRNKLKLIIAIVSFCFAFNSFAELQISQAEFGLRLFDQEKAKVPVNRIFQSSDGFIWLGTNNGLLRYDGSRIRSFSAQSPGNDPWLSNDVVMDIVEDDDKNLWISTYGGGLNRFSLIDESFFPFRTDRPDGFLTSDTLLDIEFDDKTQTLWIGSRSWLNRFELKNHSIERLGVKDTDVEFNNNVWSTVVDNDGKVWIGTLGGGVYRYDPQTREVKQFSKEQGLSNEYARSMAKDHNGNIWIATDNGLNKIEPASERVSNYFAGTEPGQLKSSELNKVYVDKSGYLWVGTWGAGASRFDHQSNTFSNYDFSSLELKKSQTPIYVYDFLEDNQGTMWIATEKGVVQFPQVSRLTQLFSAQSARSDVTAVLADAQQQWFAIGKTLINHKTQKQIDFDGAISSLAAGKNNDLWVGTNSAGLYRISKDGEVLERFLQTMPDNKDLKLWVGRIIPLTQNKVLLGLLRTNGTTGGLVLFDTEKGILHHALENDIIRDIVAVDENTFLIGTNNDGVFTLSLDDFTVESIRYGLMREIAHVLDMLVLDDGAVLIATQGQGIIRLDLAYKLAREVLQGIGSGHWMVKNLQGDIWLASDKTLQLVDGQSLKLKKSLEGILTASGFSSSAVAMTPESLLVGTTHGLFSIKAMPEQNTIAEHQLAFTGLSILNQPVSVDKDDADARLTQTINTTTDIRLSHDEHLFSLAFSVLSYDRPKAFNYRYMLEGADKTRIDAPKGEPQATYSNVSPGNYVLKVWAFDSITNDLRAEGSINVEITPPWWRTNAAFVAYGLSILALLYLIIHLRTSRLKKTAVALEKAVKERTTELEASNQEITELVAQKDFIFTAVSHEFRTPLTLIANPLKDLLERQKDKEEADSLGLIHRNVVRLSDLVEQILHLAMVKDLQSKRLQTFSVNQMFEALLAAYAPLAKVKDIELVSGEHVDGAISLEKDAPEQLFGNLITNAIKYSPSGQKVYLSAKAEDELVHIVISDTGEGIAEDKQKQIFERFNRGSHQDDLLVKGVGLGLTIVQELVELHQGQLHLESTPGKGSTFTVTLPRAEETDQTTTLATISVPDTHLITNDIEEAVEVPVESDENDESLPIVLFVEDNAELRRYFAKEFGQRFDCRVAVDGEQGLEMAKELVPDLIVSDVMMPNMDGFDLCKAIKTDSLLCHIPVVLLTAKADVDSRKHGWQLYADDYMIKPFDKNELGLRIDNLLAIRQLLQKHYAQQTTVQETQEVEKPVVIPPGVSAMDKAFIEKVDSYLSGHFQMPELQLADLSSHMALSDRQLQRKLKALIGRTFSDHLKQYRLTQSLPMLEKEIPVGVIADEVGFSSPSYYSACFKSQYGKTPKQYQAEKVIEAQ